METLQPLHGENVYKPVPATNIRFLVLKAVAKEDALKPHQA